MRRGVIALSSVRGAVRRWRALYVAGTALAIVAAGTVTAEAIPTDPDPTGNPCYAKVLSSMSVSNRSVALGQPVRVSWSINAQYPCRPTFVSITFHEASHGALVGTSLDTGGALGMSGAALDAPQSDGTYTLLAHYAGGVALDLESAQVKVALPVVDGHPEVSLNGPNEQGLFAQAVAMPNAVVRIASTASVNLTHLDPIVVAPGVKIIGERNTSGPLGPRVYTTGLRTTPDVPVLLEIGTPYTPSDNVRITGIRLDGGQGLDSAGGDAPTPVGIRNWAGINLEIDHNELYGWAGAAVSIRDNDDDRLGSAPAKSALVRVHDNYIHHNQHLGGNGYGVETIYGAWATIDQNAFNFNRHAIAGDGRPGSGYSALRNFVGSGGGINTDLIVKKIYTHIFDMHGRETCMGIGYYCGDAGEGMDIEYNTFFYSAGTDIKERGNPSGSVFVRHNAFPYDILHAYNKAPYGLPEVDNAAMVQTTSIVQKDFVVSDNKYSIDPGSIVSNAGLCDFDGDGTKDPFYTTSVTWWYGSSRLNYQWVYLNTSDAWITSLKLKDYNGDGLCDVSSPSGVFYNPGVYQPPGSATAPAGWFALQNRNSGKCVDARGGATGNGTAIQQWPCNGTYAQQFQFERTNYGYVEVSVRNTPAQVIDVNGASTSEMAAVQLWAYSVGANQQWMLVPEGGGYYHLVNMLSGKCLDVPWGSTADGVQLWQWWCNSSPAQSFRLIVQG